jgi:hypothetical protein
MPNRFLYYTELFGRIAKLISYNIITVKLWVLRVEL